QEIDDLFTIIKRLRDEGHGIVYISHRLEELAYIVDRVMILRDGQYIRSMDFGDTSLEEIISLMVGREITEKFPRIKREVGKKMLNEESINVWNYVKDINFALYE